MKVCGSDHRLAVSKVYAPYRVDRHSNSQGGLSLQQLPKERLNIESLQNESTVFLYQTRLERKLEIQERTVEEEYLHIKECIREDAVEALGVVDTRERPDWMDRDIEEKIKKKKRLTKILTGKGCG